MARYDEPGWPERSARRDYDTEYRPRTRQYDAGGYAPRPSSRRAPWWKRGLSEFGTGGGAYDTEYDSAAQGSGSRARGRRRGAAEAGWSPEHPQGRLRSARQVRVAEIMTRDPEAVTPETPIVEAAHLMAERDVGVIPVVENLESRRLCGILTDRDLVVRALANGLAGGTSVSQVMTHQVASVNQNDSIHDVFDLMKRWRVRRVPVTDREGRLVGIIAQADLAVDYAGLDIERELEVEEVIERISEPAQPRRQGVRQTVYFPRRSASRWGYVIGPTEYGGDVSFRPPGSRGLDAW